MPTNRSSTPDRSKVELARRIATAIVSYRLGVSYQTAQKDYGRDEDPHPRIVEACWRLYEAMSEGALEELGMARDKKAGAALGKRPDESTEEKLLAMVSNFIQAVKNQERVHYGGSFTNDPMLPGIFVAFVSCPDEMADRLKVRMDEIVSAEFAEEGAKKVKLQ